MSPRKAMKIRSVRVPDAVWDAEQAKADEREENLSEIIRTALVKYTNKKD